MSKRQLGERLADAWLREIPPFFSELVDKGERHNGHPVFTLQARFPDQVVTLRVFRYTPLNSEHSLLAFVPEGVK